MAKKTVNIDPELLGLTFRYRPYDAQAHGRVLPDGGFMVLAGSTAVKDSSATKKRDREERDRLVRHGILAATGDSKLLKFTRDHEFTSASRAAGIIKDGNASGPQLWIEIKSGKSLKDFLSPSS
ncbi:DUF4357 domain-containing protein [Mesorhizobium sp.]|uniref:DUF4357 domain-containing protein n=1 Tax=Mesorhizobium sp. TaxID=1871066 RepID=UPI000FE9BBC7|nr:DUF4357 domain-containing protein [Mesorhizobium sp.]RWN61242.1 MAG: DUF4357 domain-containing protein [Mesorhizobium sp.]